MSDQSNEKPQLNGHHQNDLPDPQVLASAKRRQYSSSYKLRIIAEADACNKSGEISALLRREGLYSSNLSGWRKQKQKGLLSQGKVPKRGRKEKDLRDKEIEKLRAENEKLKVKLSHAETIIDVQKKLSQAFGLSPIEVPSSAKD
jgi:transposase-like protein